MILRRVNCGKGALRARFWLETCAGLASVIGLIVTTAVSDWIELGFGIDPDGHSGEVEWMIVTAFAIATVGLGALARIEWNRAFALR